MSQNSTSVSAKASIFQIFSTCCSTSGLRIMQNNGLSARVHHRTGKAQAPVTTLYGTQTQPLISCLQ